MSGGCVFKSREKFGQLLLSAHMMANPVDNRFWRTILLVASQCQPYRPELSLPDLYSLIV
jgi:hypothetical protein